MGEEPFDDIAGDEVETFCSRYFATPAADSVASADEI